MERDGLSETETGTQIVYRNRSGMNSCLIAASIGMRITMSLIRLDKIPA